MANEFVARKGLIVSGSAAVTGIKGVSNGILRNVNGTITNSGIVTVNTISGTSASQLPTENAVVNYVTGLGYGTGSVTSVGIVANGGLSVTPAKIQTSGSFTLNTTGNLSALNSLSATGIIVRTGAGAVAARSLAAGAGISISAADGVSGDPEITNTDLGSSQNIFKSIAVSGQTTITANSNTTTLTAAAGTNVSLTTNNTTKTLTISSPHNVGQYVVPRANSSGELITTDMYYNNSCLGFNTSGVGGLQTIHIKSASNAYMLIETDADNQECGIFYKKEDTDATMTRTKGLIVFASESNSTLNGWGGGVFRFCINTETNGNTVSSRNDTKFMMSGSGDFHADGDVIAYSTTISDGRFKNNVKTLTGSLAKLQQIRGVSFDWDGRVRSGQDIGVIAQEVEKVFPEAVVEKNHIRLPGKYKTVYYDKLIPVLVEALKEQQDIIAKLESRIQALEYKI